MSDAPAWDLGRYRPLIRLLAYGLLRGWPKLQGRLDQSDLANDVLLEAHKGLAHFRGNTEEDLLKWLRAILANKFRDICRRECGPGRNPALEQSIDESLMRSSVRLGAFLEATGSSPSEAAQRREALVDLAAALDALSPDQRALLVAHYIEGESFRSIGQRLNLPPTTVFERIAEARSKLRERLGGHESEGSHGR